MFYICKTKSEIMKTRTSIKNQNSLYKYLTGNRKEVKNEAIRQSEDLKPILKDESFNISNTDFNSKEEAEIAQKMAVGRFLMIMLGEKKNYTLEEINKCIDVTLSAKEYLNQ